MPSAFRDRGCGAGLGDDGQVAGLRTGGQPHAQMSDTLPGRCTQRVAPERLVGDQIPDLRQAAREAGVRTSIAASFPLPYYVHTIQASLLLTYIYSILVRWLNIIAQLILTGCLPPA
jgi:hypothetical protein